jgi:hypothetical protein
MYCFEITIKQMHKIWTRDRTRDNYGSLYTRLCAIDGIHSVEYDGHFGANIFVMIDEPFDESLEKAKKEIAKYIR